MSKLLCYTLFTVFGLSIYACSVNNNDDPEPTKMPTIWDKLAGTYTGDGMCISWQNADIDTTYYTSKSFLVDSITPGKLYTPHGYISELEGDSVLNTTSGILKYYYYGTNGKFDYAEFDTLTLELHWESGGGYSYTKNKCIFDYLHD